MPHRQAPPSTVARSSCTYAPMTLAFLFLGLAATSSFVDGRLVRVATATPLACTLATSAAQ
ncbi:hypothetical protein SESBI_16166 [Sesbania bispinosa]|nr:hypothetical protein SESBI_16166 [Sesbania bispinosa]